MSNLEMKLGAIQKHRALKEHEFDLENKLEKAKRVSRTLYIADLMNQEHNIKAQIMQEQVDNKRMEG